MLAHLTMLILKASVPDLALSAEEPLTQQYFLRLSSFAASCTCLMVSGEAFGASTSALALSKALLVPGPQSVARVLVAGK